MALPSTSTSLTLLDCLRQSHPPVTAWERFVRIYTPLLYEWASRQGFHDADRADLTQEVLIKLLRKLPEYQSKPGHSFRSWLFAVARNEGRDYRRNRGTRGLPAADGLSGYADGAPFNEMEEAEYCRFVVHRALSMIRSEFKEDVCQAFERHKILGKPAAEVAAELGMTEGALYTACSRVMTRLREEIGGFVE